MLPTARPLELRFVTPDLPRLDELDSELLFAAVLSDERPVRGVAGLLDWRLGGRISRLLASGFFRGELGERLLVPGRPKTSFDKICLFGAGPAEALDERVVTRLVGDMLTAMTDLRARGGIVEVPGRHVGRVAPDVAAGIVLAEAERLAPSLDMWVLVEDADARTAIEKLVADLKRRRRRIEEPLDGL